MNEQVTRAVATDDAALIRLLIEIAERVAGNRLGVLPAEQVAALNQELVQRRAGPVPEGGHVIGEHHVVLSEVLGHLLTARGLHDDRMVRHWGQLIGVMLPDVRDDHLEALRRRNARPST